MVNLSSLLQKAHIENIAKVTACIWNLELRRLIVESIHTAVNNTSFASITSQEKTLKGSTE